MLISWFHNPIVKVRTLHPILKSLAINGYDTVKLNSYDVHYNDADFEGAVSSDHSGVSPSLIAFFSLACRLSTHLLLCWGNWWFVLRKQHHHHRHKYCVNIACRLSTHWLRCWGYWWPTKHKHHHHHRHHDYRQYHHNCPSLQYLSSFSHSHLPLCLGYWWFTFKHHHHCHDYCLISGVFSDLFCLSFW